MNDDEWYHELRARYKMAMSMKAQKREIIMPGRNLIILNQNFTILMHGQD